MASGVPKPGARASAAADAPGSAVADGVADGVVAGTPARVAGGLVCPRASPIPKKTQPTKNAESFFIGVEHNRGD